MSSSTKDYRKQLQEALNVTRQELLARMDKAQGDRSIALPAQEIAQNDRIDAHIGLNRAHDLRLVAAAIEERAWHAKLVVRNLAQFAQAAASAATATAASMSTAAAGVKEAAVALETLTKSAYGVTAVAHSNDQRDELDTGAKETAAALKAALDSVNALKSVSLESNVQAAQPLAATAAQTFELVKTQFDAIAADAAASLGRSNELAQKALEKRKTTEDFYSTQITPFEGATQNGKALLLALTEVDRATEGLLEVSVEGTETPVLKVTCPTLELATEKSPRFVAVEGGVVPQFKYATRMSAVPATTATDEETKKPLLTAEIKADHAGKSLAYGHSYYVFVCWQRKQHEENNDDALLWVQSLPSAPILLKRRGKTPPPAPTVVCLPADAFVIGVDGPADLRHPIKEYRLFIVPTQLWRSNREDDLYLAGRAGAARYLSLSPKGKRDPGRIEEILKRNARDILLARLPAGVTETQAQQADLEKSLGHRQQLVYFSPLEEDSPGDKPGSGLVLGTYSDAFGDPIDLTRKTYRAAVVYVLKDPGGDTDPVVEGAESILSDPASIPPTPASPAPAGSHS